MDRVRKEWVQLESDPSVHEFKGYKNWTVRCEDVDVVRKFQHYAKDRTLRYTHIWFTVPDWKGDRIGYLSFKLQDPVTFIKAFRLIMDEYNDPDFSSDDPDACCGDAIHPKFGYLYDIQFSEHHRNEVTFKIWRLPKEEYWNLYNTNYEALYNIDFDLTVED